MTTQRQARNNFSRGRGVFACESCGRQTRGTPECHDAKSCSECYELAGFENMASDNGIDSITDGGFAEVERLIAKLTAAGGRFNIDDDWSGLYAGLKAWRAAKGGEAPVVVSETAYSAVRGGTLLNLCFNAKGDVTLYVNGKKYTRGTEAEARDTGYGFADGRWGVVYDRRT